MHLRRAAIILFLLPVLTVFTDSKGDLNADQGAIVIEDFSKSGNIFFREWRNRDTSEKPWNIYYLSSEGGKNFLRASTERNRRLSIQIGKPVNSAWNIFTHPFLSWQWRVHSIPANASESRSGSNDSAAGLYVIFQRRKVPLLSLQNQPANWIKYVWSSTLPVGTVIPRKKITSGVTLYEGRYVVVASGKKDLGKWITFKRDVLADYKRFFGSNPINNPLMVAILTDSNSTLSPSVADYSTITAHKN